MEKCHVFSHYCDDEKNKLFVVYSLKDRTSRKYDVPYNTHFLFDSAQIGNQIYFTGGGLPAGSEKEEVFFKTSARVTIHANLSSGTEMLSDMLVPRANHTLVALGTTALFAVGGCNNLGDTASCEMYEVAGGVWKQCPSLTEQKKWATVCTLGSKFLYAFGGVTKDTKKDSDVIECLDVEHGFTAPTWTVFHLEKGKELWKRCVFMGASEIAPGQILLFGGLVNKADSAESFIFAPANKSLTRTAPLAEPEEFYRTKPQILGNELMMVGSTMCDLHVFKIPAKMWAMTEKNTWNPEDVFFLKAETH